MELWTFAIRYVVDQWNNTPHPQLDMQTPNAVFSNTNQTDSKSVNKLPHYHTFGCPVYVFDPKARDAIY